MALMAKARVERIGQGVTGACIVLVALLVVTLVAMSPGAVSLRLPPTVSTSVRF